METLIEAFARLQDSFARGAAVLPFGYAFAAGLVASVNPCGFLVLPSFGLYYLGLGSNTAQVPAVTRLGRALVAGVSATAGFVVLFAVIGIVIGLAGRALTAVFPFVGVAVGILALGTGIWLLISNKTFGITALDRFGLPAGTGPRPAFLFGIAYGVLSLACTLPIFLVVVTTSLTGSLLDALVQFVAYSLGMGTVITLVALSAALAGGALGRWLAVVRGWVPRIAGAFLVLAGVYVMYYWLVFGRLLA